MELEFLIESMLGALYAGLATGAVVAICGAIKGKIGYAIGGFFACVAAAMVLGLLLAIPICGLFLYWIFKKEPDEEPQANYRYTYNSTAAIKYCTKCGTGIINDAKFCPKCGNQLF